LPRIFCSFAFIRLESAILEVLALLIHVMNAFPYGHFRASGNPEGVGRTHWIPAFAGAGHPGMTIKMLYGL